ncbi:MAG TPA: DUF5076 domain-containing protein [Xanthobacteraceae bacterium]|jgi:hypothetical protein
MSKPYQALNIPPAANERGGFEFLRCALVDDELHLMLRPVFNAPNDWGRALAEVARQVARAYAHQGRFSEAEMLTSIESAFATEMKNPSNVASSIGPIGG